MKIEIWVATNKVGSEVTKTIDIDNEDWNEMDEADQYNYVYEVILNSSMFEWGFGEIGK